MTNTGLARGLQEAEAEKYMSYEHIKLRIKFCAAELDTLMGEVALTPEQHTKRQKHNLDASMTLSCDMTEEQQDAYISLFLLCSDTQTSKSRRVGLFKALLDGTWNKYVG